MQPSAAHSEFISISLYIMIYDAKKAGWQEGRKKMQFDK